ncbi:10162_t:CDS:2 [Acaulospora colombiana]|uniref:10162_t:CDS:1 n=1 Tax=Acaulospora colombiana TaxID=27376 RepID=A0ACA9NM49_9GLOM|nr:10162_t:CDS:2 [Acaulospora colombiana]
MTSEEIREAIDDRLKGEVKMNTMRYPQILRRYIDANWISSPGLPSFVIPIGPFQSKNQTMTTQGKLPAPPSFLSFMATNNKKNLLYIMEASLEEECKSMANLHRYVQEVLNRKFASLFVEIDTGKHEDQIIMFNTAQFVIAWYHESPISELQLHAHELYQKHFVGFGCVFFRGCAMLSLNLCVQTLISKLFSMK